MPKVFKYQVPSIPSAGVYYFTSDEGIDYEVRFGRKQSDVLATNIVFGVRNEEYEGEEYVLTNKGEFFSVMATIEEILNDFREKNPNIRVFEFSGEPTAKGPEHGKATKRTRVYLRWVKRFFPSSEWTHELVGNKVTIKRL